jgi:hypothetical protein
MIKDPMFLQDIPFMGPLTSLSFLSLSNPSPSPAALVIYVCINFSERINVVGSK